MHRHFIPRLFLTLSIMLLALSPIPGWAPSESARAETAATPGVSDSQPAKNIILFIGDGMGAVQRQAAAGYSGQILEMDALPVTGMITTHSANARVTDSAAAATAMATGHKTLNGVVSMTPEFDEIPTILEQAKRAGISVGLVATSAITHATPACFASHVFSRSMEEDIPAQYLGNRVDVLLGGGRSFFLPKSAAGSSRPDNLDLIAGFTKAGYRVITAREDLVPVNAAASGTPITAGTTGTPLLGLFAEGALQPDIERYRAGEPSLAEMTLQAINVLAANENGFFLMVEGSQIDWAGHANDPFWSVTETLALDRAVIVARRFAAVNGNTLIIVTGDHETGGMQLAGDSARSYRPEFLRKQQATGQTIARLIKENPAQTAEILREQAGVAHLAWHQRLRLRLGADPERLINAIVSKRAGVRWASTSHTGARVPVSAEGPRAGLFAGSYDNTDIYHKMKAAFGWR